MGHRGETENWKVRKETEQPIEKVLEIIFMSLEKDLLLQPWVTLERKRVMLVTTYMENGSWHDYMKWEVSSKKLSELWFFL